ncbi:MAG: UTP--glucose-1-phosphate uridylyltransferase GalU [Chromatiales bacterium]|nr:UTP--glucose-1-phosphate uridylyltransferase GalU [Chromatiales bacterium]
MARKIRKAVFPVAGLGTRFIPATKINPKEMLTVVDKPLIQYATEDAVKAGITSLIFINGRNKRAIEDHFDSVPELEQILLNKGKHKLLEKVHDIIPPNISCINIRQKQPNGLGSAILCAMSSIGMEPFAVILADDLVVNSDNNSMKQLTEYYAKYESNLIMVEEVARDQVSNYGIIEGEQVEDDVWKVNRFIEKPKTTNREKNLAAIGRYILKPSIFNYLKKTPSGKDQEIQLTDAMSLQLKHQPLYAVVCKGTRYDCGNKLGYLKANVALAMKNKEIGQEFKAYLKSLFKENSSGS